MNLAIYILIGTFFMFCVEYFLNTKTFKKYQKKVHVKTGDISMNIWSRITGIVLWPLCLVIFLYNFFEQVNKLKK